MDPEDRKLLIYVKNMAEENSRLLRRVDRYLRWARWGFFIRYALIIGFAIGAFYFFQPVLTQLGQAYQTFTGHTIDFSAFLK